MIDMTKRCAIVLDDRWWEDRRCTGEAVVRSSGPYSEAFCLLHAETGDVLAASGHTLVYAP